jgi:predicted phosphodiesterase
MRILYLSDFHGKSPLELIKRQYKENNISRVVSLGDYDNPKILEDLIDLKSDLKIDMRFLVGNHDQGVVKGLSFSSILSPDFDTLYSQWKSQNRARSFIQESLAVGAKGRKKGTKIVERINGQKAVYAHGSLLWEDAIYNNLIWGRLDSYENLAKVQSNLSIMKKKGYWALFRGHDHVSEVFSIRKRANISIENIENLTQQSPIKLEKGRRYIISIGGYFQGVYGILDTDKQEFDFFNEKNRRS